PGGDNARNGLLDCPVKPGNDKNRLTGTHAAGRIAAGGSAKREGPRASADVLGLEILFDLPRQRASGVHRLAELLLGDAEALLPICDLVRLVQIDASLVAIVSLLRWVDS